MRPTCLQTTSASTSGTSRSLTAASVSLSTHGHSCLQSAQFLLKSVFITWRQNDRTDTKPWIGSRENLGELTKFREKILCHEWRTILNGLSLSAHPVACLLCLTNESAEKTNCHPLCWFCLQTLIPYHCYSVSLPCANDLFKERYHPVWQRITLIFRVWFLEEYFCASELLWHITTHMPGESTS